LGLLRALEADSGSLRGLVRGSVASSQPGIDFFLKIVDEPRAAPMMRRANPAHAPFGERGTTNAKVLRSLDSSKSSIGVHLDLPGHLDSLVPRRLSEVP
jgi:hypothetical protein